MSLDWNEYWKLVRGWEIGRGGGLDIWGWMGTEGEELRVGRERKVRSKKAYSLIKGLIESRASNTDFR
jgi:hypothetical protein